MPELLLDTIAEKGARARDALVGLIADAGAPRAARMTAINLLREMDQPPPAELFIAWQLDRELEDELADCALESLEAAGEGPLPAMLEALPQAGEAGQEALLSVMSRYPDLPGVYEALIRLFDAAPERTAALSAYLGRLGDERALPLLKARALAPEIGYIDYIELRSAIEALGGEAPEREFEDDRPTGRWPGRSERDDLQVLPARVEPRLPHLPLLRAVHGGRGGNQRGRHHGGRPQH